MKNVLLHLNAAVQVNRAGVKRKHSKVIEEMLPASPQNFAQQQQLQGQRNSDHAQSVQQPGSHNASASNTSSSQSSVASKVASFNQQVPTTSYMHSPIPFLHHTRSQAQSVSQPASFQATNPSGEGMSAKELAEFLAPQVI